MCVRAIGFRENRNNQHLCIETAQSRVPLGFSAVRYDSGCPWNQVEKRPSLFGTHAVDRRTDIADA
jgi:hypothetical protein